MTGRPGEKGGVFRELSGVDEALRVLLDLSTPVSRVEYLPLDKAAGRVLSGKVTSRRDLPGFDRSAMDGYAVRAQETRGATPLSPVYLKLYEDCLPVRTGAPVAKGYDAVVMVEDAVPKDGEVEITAEVHPYRNLSRRGEDVAVGDLVLEEGRRLRPPDLALLGALGMTQVEVYQRPKVAVLPTGSELVPLGKWDLEPGKAYEINGLMTELYVGAWGGLAHSADIIPDDPSLIRKAIADNAGADLILLSGGTSVGDRDYAPGAIAGMGEVLFHGLRITPGKPTAVGVVGGTPVVCLPGYPVAALSALYLLVRAAVKRMARLADVPPRRKAVLERKIWSRPGYLTVARVALEGDAAVPIMTSGAGILSSVTRADGFVLVPEELEGLEAGEVVDVTLFE